MCPLPAPPRRPPRLRSVHLPRVRPPPSLPATHGRGPPSKDCVPQGRGRRHRAPPRCFQPPQCNRLRRTRIATYAVAHPGAGCRPQSHFRRPRRAPQPASVLRADREGSCAVVAGGGTFLDVTANFADGPVIEVHVERSSVATVAYCLQVSILTSNDDGAMSRTEAATRVIENDISTARMASRMLHPPPIFKHREGRPPRPVLIVHEVVEVEV